MCDFRTKLTERLKKRNKDLIAAQQAASQVQQLAGAVNEIALLLIDEGMTEKEIQELLNAAQ